MKQRLQIIKNNVFIHFGQNLNKNIFRLLKIMYFNIGFDIIENNIYYRVEEEVI